MFVADKSVTTTRDTSRFNTSMFVADKSLQKILTQDMSVDDIKFVEISGVIIFLVTFNASLIVIVPLIITALCINKDPWVFICPLISKVPLISVFPKDATVKLPLANVPTSPRKSTLLTS